MSGSIESPPVRFVPKKRSIGSLISWVYEHKNFVGVHACKTTHVEVGIWL